MPQTCQSLDDIVGRVEPQLRQCVREVGRARGRHDAIAIMAALDEATIVDLCHQLVRQPVLIPGTLIAELGSRGIISNKAQLFAPNGGGYFSTFCAHTVQMLLSEADRQDLEVCGATPDAVAEALREACIWELTTGWEWAVAEHLDTVALVPA